MNIEVIKDELSGWYVTHVPTLNVVAQAETQERALEEAKASIRDLALDARLDAFVRLDEEGGPPPAAEQVWEDVVNAAWVALNKCSAKFDGVYFQEVEYGDACVEFTNSQGSVLVEIPSWFLTWSGLSKGAKCVQVNTWDHEALVRFLDERLGA